MAHVVSYLKVEPETDVYRILETFPG